MEASFVPSWKEQIRQERIRRNWRQQDLADHLGTTVVTIQRWERGSQQPSAYYRVKLCALFGKSAEELGLVEKSPGQDALDEGSDDPLEGEELRLWAVPYPHNPFFLGHEEDLIYVRRCLQAGQATALAQPQAISGLGGIGKTQLALEYAYRYAQEYQVILWAHADSPEALVSSYVAFASLLQLPEREASEQEDIVKAVKRWLQTHTAWLLILDNADELATIPDFLPPRLGGHLLLTTRAEATGRLAHRIEIETLSPEQGALLVLLRSRLLPPDAPLEQASPEEQALALRLSQELGGLPLALDQVGAYLEETGIPLEAYWPLYQQYRAELLRERRGGFVSDHPLPVATTWSVSFQRIEERNPGAAELLRLLAWLPPDVIAEEILPAGAAFLGPVLAPIVENDLLLNQALETLRAYSLVRRDPRTRQLSLHRLVQAVLQDQQDEVERQTWTERAVRAINAAFPQVEYEMWARCERLLPLALAAAERIEQQRMLFEEAGHLLFETAAYLQARARYREAEPLLQRALRIYEDLLGLDHPQVAFPLQSLANLYSDQGKFKEAETLHQRALRIREQHLGPEHVLVAAPLNSLAVLYCEQGKYGEAEPLFQRALCIREQHLGSEHPHVATVLNNLAQLSFLQGKCEQAEALHLRALHIREQFLRSGHPLLASTLNNLAETYTSQGRYGEAEALLQRALRTYEQQFGPDHPDVVFSLNNLADLYASQKRYEEAEVLYQRAVRISEQQLGAENPRGAFPLTNLAVLYTEQGKYGEAEPLFQRALHIREQFLGPESPETAETIHGLATLRAAQDRFQEALSLYRLALAIREQVLGAEHPKTTETRTRLYATVRAMGKAEKDSNQLLWEQIQLKP